jgi:hypothetical protein
MLDSVFDQTVAGVLILGPVVAAVILLVLGGTRNYRWFRQKLKLLFREFDL